MHKPNGPRVGLLEFEGFDTHALQGNEEGHHAENLAELDSVLQNFKKNMGQLYNKTVVVTVTEFGALQRKMVRGELIMGTLVPFSLRRR